MRSAFTAAMVLLARPLFPAQAAPPPAAAGKTAVAEIRFTLENSQIHPIRYSLRIAEDGSGDYRSTAGGALPSDSGSGLIIVPDQSRPIQVGTALRARLFQIARRNRFFGVHCQANGDVAFTGTRTLEYGGPDGQGSCTFTWTKLKDIEELTGILQGIACTLDQGGLLTIEHAHTPLALDTGLDDLAQMAQQGQALELENIAPVLTAIAEDEHVIERDQRLARELLSFDKAD